MSKAKHTKKQADTNAKSPEHFFIFGKQNAESHCLVTHICIPGYLLNQEKPSDDDPFGGRSRPETAVGVADRDRP